jgi:predicted SnoaL-like aldol condensation-catalyzing enzyme
LVTDSKDLVRRFYAEVFNTGDAASAHLFLRADYQQRGDGVESGLAAWTVFLRGLHERFPELRYEVLHVFGDGDHVIVHGRFRRTPDDPGSEIVDFFRVQDGLLAEHWEVIQRPASTQ